MRSPENLTIENTTKGKLPGLPFADMKNAIVGKNYSLSLVFVGEKRSRALNKTYRGKDKPTNVLSFPLSDTEGEIYIAPVRVKKELRKFGMRYKNLLGFLFIHGLLHLKGFDHGSTMEYEEEKFRKQFGL